MSNMQNLAALLGGATNTATKTKTDGLVVTDPNLIALAIPFADARREVELAESKLAVAETRLKPEIRRFWLNENASRPKPEGTVRIVLPDGAKVTASFAAQWYPAAGVSLTQIGVPKDLVRPTLSITVKGDQIPENIQEQVISDLVGVMQRHGCMAALSYKLAEYPRAEFATARHTRLTPAQNESLELAGLNTRLSIKV